MLKVSTQQATPDVYPPAPLSTANSIESIDCSSRPAPPALKQRGSLTFWFDEAVLAQWIVSALSGQRRASVFYSDLAIATMATVKAVYGLARRQCEGFLASIYHRRSMTVPAMFRFKTIFGGALQARRFDNQTAELLIQCAALNRMFQIAKPDSYLFEA